MPSMRSLTAPAPSSTSSAPASSEARRLTTAGFGVYVHWPFCASKCPYCDFNSHVRAGGIDEARFLAAYLRELRALARRCAGPREVASIFFGGGTPSLMQPRTVGAILDAHRGAVARRRPTPRSRSRPIPAASRPSASAAIAQQESIACRSACSRSTTTICSRSDACIPSLKHSPPSRSRERTLRPLLLRPDLRAARARRSTTGGTSLAKRWRSRGGHLSLYQLTIEPETPFAALHAAASS